MTAFSDFYPFIRPDIPGCLESAFDAELLRISNHFCQNTWAWRYDTTESVSEDDEEIYVMAPSRSILIGVVSAKVNDVNFYDFTISSDNTIVLDSSATSDFSIVFELALKPAMNSTTLPDVLFDDHLDAIVAGVKRNLFISPKKSWTDPSLSVHYDRIYRAAVSEEKINASKDANLVRVRSIGWV